MLGEEREKRRERGRECSEPCRCYQRQDLAALGEAPTSPLRASRISSWNFDGSGDHGSAKWVYFSATSRFSLSAIIHLRAFFPPTSPSHAVS